MKIYTESGAVYETTKDGGKIRRLRNKLPIDPEAEVQRVPMKQDGKWLKLSQPAEPVVGLRLFLMVETEESAQISVRQTSTVVGVAQ